MDEYLESLIRKDEEVTPAEDVANEVITEEVASPAEEVDAPAETVDKVVTEEVAVENGDPSVVVSSEPESSNSKPEYKIDNTYSVSDIRVYNVPDKSQVCRIFTGNFIYKGKVDGYHIIDYMKPGWSR